MDNDGGVLDEILGDGTDHKIFSKSLSFIMATADGQIGIPANAARAIKPACASKAQAADVDTCPQAAQCKTQRQIKAALQAGRPPAGLEAGGFKPSSTCWRLIWMLISGQHHVGSFHRAVGARADDELRHVSKRHEKTVCAARRNPCDNIPRPPVFADGRRCRRPGGQSGTEPCRPASRAK